ncbi:hypothetical protein GCM10009827_005930 [Dactylosporangium maewongense]|uniref:Uncharacterized protein n=1 Tax=Dactylosporangium maewongense TaxID=634393 RepID=A0ABN1ZK87_9ACTN
MLFTTQIQPRQAGSDPPGCATPAPTRDRRRRGPPPGSARDPIRAPCHRPHASLCVTGPTHRSVSPAPRITRTAGGGRPVLVGQHETDPAPYAAVRPCPRRTVCRRPTVPATSRDEVRE